ncbi:hypothetical protein KUV26_02615 [Leisingera daeponensis]|uniref:Outer membrane protein beta-barrel domain-containing protein n=2 Tax=Leisingera daeponensis TaxID=405746 RepID=A0ABS7NAU4_9RHOB|nr:hypothetical protein [Leisingera daeponensis]
MPMVRKTKLCQAVAAALTFAAFPGTPVVAEDPVQPFITSVSHVSQNASGNEAQAFEFGYGLDSDGVIIGGRLATGQNGPLTRADLAEETHQLRLHAGYDFGPATGFVTVGGLQAEASSGRRHGSLFGFGMRVSLNRALQLTGEILHHEAGAKDGSVSLRGQTLAVSAAFRF